MGILAGLVLLVSVFVIIIRIKGASKKEEMSQCTGECEKCGRCH